MALFKKKQRADPETEKLKSFLEMCIRDRVHGVRLAESRSGLSIIMPQRGYEKDGKKLYTDIFHPVTGGARAALKEAVIDAYRKATK